MSSLSSRTIKFRIYQPLQQQLLDYFIQSEIINLDDREIFQNGNLYITFDSLIYAQYVYDQLKYFNQQYLCIAEEMVKDPIAFFLVDYVIIQKYFDIDAIQKHLQTFGTIYQVRHQNLFQFQSNCKNDILMIQFDRISSFNRFKNSRQFNDSFNQINQLWDQLFTFESEKTSNIYLNHLSRSLDSKILKLLDQNIQTTTRRVEKCENNSFQISEIMLLQGKEVRTTLMMKNIPNKLLQKDLIQYLDSMFFGTYDFLYLPIDFQNHCNIGYAFLNIPNPQDLLKLFRYFNNRKWVDVRSEKICNLTFARIQGRHDLLVHFQKSTGINTLDDPTLKPLIIPSFKLDAEVFLK